jgi:arylsulfatase A-like enzyme
VSILDVTPTALSLLGLEPPADLDGRVATELLAGDAEVGERRAVGAVERRPDPRAYNEEEEDAIKERLRGLGYID